MMMIVHVNKARQLIAGSLSFSFYRQEFPLLLMEILDEPVDTVLKLINKIRMKINDISTDKGECTFKYRGSVTHDSLYVPEEAWVNEVVQAMMVMMTL